MHTVCFHLYNSRNANESTVTEDRWLPGDGGGGGGTEDRDYKGHNETLGDDGYIHYLLYAYVKTHQIVHFKYVQFIVSQYSF